MSASQAEGRGFKSRFPLQKIEGVASYDVTPFLMRPTAVPPMGLFRALLSRPAPPKTGNTSMSHGFSDSLFSGCCGRKKEVSFRFMEASDTLNCQPQRGHITIGSIGKQTPSIFHTVFCRTPSLMECLCFHLLSMYWNSRLLRFQSNEAAFPPVLLFYLQEHHDRIVYRTGIVPRTFESR